MREKMSNGMLFVLFVGFMAFFIMFILGIAQFQRVGDVLGAFGW